MVGIILTLLKLWLNILWLFLFLFFLLLLLFFVISTLIAALFICTFGGLLAFTSFTAFLLLLAAF